MFGNEWCFWARQWWALCGIWQKNCCELLAKTCKYLAGFANSTSLNIATPGRSQGEIAILFPQTRYFRKSLDLKRFAKAPRHKLRGIIKETHYGTATETSRKHYENKRTRHKTHQHNKNTMFWQTHNLFKGRQGHLKFKVGRKMDHYLWINQMTFRTFT